MIALRSFPLDLNKKILFFNRIEPALLFTKRKNPKIAVIHNDIPAQILGGKGETLWRLFPGIYKSIERYIFGSLDHIYTVSESTLNFYIKNYHVPKKQNIILADMGGHRYL